MSIAVAAQPRSWVARALPLAVASSDCLKKCVRARQTGFSSLLEYQDSLQHFVAEGLSVLSNCQPALQSLWEGGEQLHSFAAFCVRSHCSVFFVSPLYFYREVKLQSK